MVPSGFKFLSGLTIVTTLSVGAHEVSNECAEHGLGIRVIPSSNVRQKFTLLEQSIPLRPILKNKLKKKYLQILNIFRSVAYH